jgi:hypothetical protein
VRPKAKYAVIFRHREEYPVSVMCKFFGVSRSGYYDFVKRIGKPEQDAALLREAGFDDVELFYAGFTFKGWVASRRP